MRLKEPLGGNFTPVFIGEQHGRRSNTISHGEVLNSFRQVGLFHEHSGAPFLWVTADLQSNDDRPCVYAWVAESKSGKQEIIYIGKSGTGVAKRHKTHETGFAKSNRGKGHAAIISDCLRKGRVTIWTFIPDPIAIDGFAGSFSPATSLEEHLLKVVEPTPVRNRENRSGRAVTVFDVEDGSLAETAAQLQPHAKFSNTQSD